MNAMFSRKPYDGLHRRLVIGLDVGHSFRASYCILCPGDTPVVQCVNRYPGQEQVSSDAKIPAILYYDSMGYVRAVGAEALWDSVLERAHREGWIKVEWSNVYFWSETGEDTGIPRLPLNKTAEDVFSDFLRYLNRCTQVHIRETHPDSQESQMDVVLVHQNDCGIAQQEQMRRAAIRARLVPDTPDGHLCIKFVAEGEAILRYCIYNNLALDIITSGEGVIVVDAGEGIELSAFYLKNPPNDLKEIAPPIRDFRGWTSVTRHARAFIENKLCNSRYGSPEDIDLIMNCFDKANKLSFKDSTQATYITFGTPDDTDAFVDIKFGQLKLQGSDMASFFKPSIVAIQEAIQEQAIVAEVPVTSVLLVGSLAANDWLISNLRAHLHTNGLRLYRPDLPIAISDGAILSLDCFVSPETKKHERKQPITDLPTDHRLIAELEARNRELEQTLNNAERQRNEQRTQAREERKKAEFLASQLRTLEQAQASSEERITILTEEVSRLTSLDKANHKLERRYGELWNAYQSLEAKAEEQQKASSKQVHDLRTENEYLHRELLHLTQDAQTQQLYAEQLTAELKQLTLAQQLHSPADSVTEEDVQRLVEKLNHEILQCATHLRSAVEAESASSKNLVDVCSEPYAGSHRKLIIGMDVGTTYSGVSYCILDPGVVPIIQGVNRYPAQQKVGGDAKIPSILYYDGSGSVRAVGDEALLGSNIELAEENHWIKVQWFKLHLRLDLATDGKDEPIPPLPPNKTIVEVFGDFLRYLYSCTRSYIQETHASGLEAWESMQNDIEFVLTHPNGWERAQLAQMRNAAAYGGLVPNTPRGQSRIYFLKEGEASLYHCIRNSFASDVIKSGEGVIIVDAGGGTLDLSAYRVKDVHNRHEEIAPPKCYFQGSVFVTRHAETFLKNKLAGSRYDTPDDISVMAACFDKSTKLSFKDASQLSYIKFGMPRETDLSVGIKFGQLKLQGSEVATFFQPSISTLQRAIQEQMNAANVPVTSVLLVGGFAASSWLFSNLHGHLKAKQVRLSRPDGHLGKAVANGAVSFLINYLTARQDIKLPQRALCQEEIDDDTSDQHMSTADIGIRELAGLPVIRLLQAARNMEDPSLAVHMAVRASLVSFCNHLVSSWHHSRDPGIEEAFHNLYTVLRQNVATPIAVNWRALTRSNLDRLRDGPGQEDFVSQITRLVLSTLSAILSFVGYPHGLSEQLADELSTNLSFIATSTLELRTAIGEKALSCDMDTFIYLSGTSFDGNTMKNIFERQSTGNTDNARAQLILCTVEMGLKRSKVAVAGDKDMTSVEKIILKPRIVLGP